ncbi:hypothetical protein C9382_21630 [Pseudomonas aylmerensis]|uniref:Uncharacterized protein n=1 Tax=Pseudomonas aylmerensis TaxID=1869229 RepID=A0A2T4FRY3_9PSED|nr:hypothetical protein C9382_21630 [Pseudomonas aylmerensis]
MFALWRAVRGRAQALPGFHSLVDQPAYSSPPFCLVADVVQRVAIAQLLVDQALNRECPVA